MPISLKLKEIFKKYVRIMLYIQLTMKERARGQLDHGVKSMKGEGQLKGNL